MTGLLRLEGRNAVARTGALVRLGVIPLLLLFEALEAPSSPHDLGFGEPIIGVLLVYAVAAAGFAFVARREVPVAPFAIADTALLSLLVCAEGGAVADVRFVLFVPVLVAVLSGPRLTLAIGALSVVGFVAAALANPDFADAVGARLLIVHTLDIAWRAGLAVLVAMLLSQRAERIRRLAEGRRSLVTQALGAEARARRELSYALHDELVQELLCARQDLKAAQRGRPEYIDRADAALAVAVDRLRREIFQLHPHVLETAGLEAALTAIAAQGSAAAAVITVDAEAGGVHDELLFSLGRELLANVARHAEARHVELTVERRDGAVVLRCRDDGRGLPPERREAALAGGHLGLAACTERVEAVGGTLELVSRAGGGTEVCATIPVDEPAAAPASAPSRRPDTAPLARPAPAGPAT